MEDNERLKAIWARTVEKLKEVVQEFKITQDELHLAGDYFNRLGQSGMCRSLVDVALAMTSIDATVAVTNGTRPNLEGPAAAGRQSAGARPRPRLAQVGVVGPGDRCGDRRTHSRGPYGFLAG
jgi:hypothetical protein